MKQIESTDEADDSIELTYDEATYLEDDVSPATYRAAAHRLSALEERGVTVEWTCGECGDPVETTVLPEERDKPDYLKVSICKECIAAELRDAEWFDPEEWIES